MRRGCGVETWAGRQSLRGVTSSCCFINGIAIKQDIIDPMYAKRLRVIEYHRVCLDR
jgi:hypothetical protein